MNRPGFVHLHLHSQFSILESTVRFEPLMARLKELGMSGAALTDRGNLFGSVPFYQTALEHGLKPILGCEIWVANGPARPGRPDVAHPLVLLAENGEGYQNLVKLSSAGFLQGDGSYPVVDEGLLARHAGGLIALSGGPEGKIDRFLLKGESPLALKAAGRYQELFGRDRFFLEVQDHGRPDEKTVRDGLLETARRASVPLVATNDVRYLRKEEAAFHEVLLCLGKGQVLSDPAHATLGSEEHYLRSAEEMNRLFTDVPGAVSRTLEISERCHATFLFGTTRMPSFKVPEKGLTEAAYLERICREGLPRRYGARASDPVVLDRMARELEIIRATGFSGYFLIVWDFIREARKRGISVGPGRGSAAGSLVAYLTGITGVDPIQYNLLFERFINPERVSAPDIDVDVSDRHRQEVLDYITETYGRDRVASIVTFGTMAAKAVVRDAARVLEVPLAEVDRIAKLIPGEPKTTLEDAMERVPELRAIATERGPFRRLLDVSRALEGLVRHVSTHAAGIIIGNQPLEEEVPLCRGAGGEVLTQYDMNILKDVGLLKLDILGLRTLTVIDDTVNAVRLGRRPELVLAGIPLDDPATYRLLKEARTGGVFQLESRGMRDYLRKLAPENIEDLIALLALYRPGPLGSDMVNDFIQRKKGLVKVGYLHPRIEPVLRTTYGVILYQEQVMQIAKEIAGFSLGQADLLRRAMGSKDPEQMEAMRGKFIEGALERKVPRDEAETLFNQMAKFAGYGFNKSHSAAYALVAYQTAYLKANFTAEFMASLLTSESGNQDKISQYIFECRKFGVKVLPPDVNLSADRFTVTPRSEVRFSLSAIKNVGSPSVRSILEARAKGGPYKTLFDFCERVDLKSFTPRMVECLVQAGAFDAMGSSRAAMRAGVEKVFRQSQWVQADTQRGQTTMFETIATEAKGSLPAVPEASPAQELMEEKEVLGFYLSGHPLSEHVWELEHYVTPLHELEEMPDGFEVRVAGLVRGLSKSMVKRTKELYGRFTLEDLHSHAEVIAWPEVFKKQGNRLVTDKLVAIRGRLDKTGDRVQVIANEIIDLNELAVLWAKEVHLRMNVIGMDDQLLPRVKGVCQKHPGKVKVFLHMQTTHHGLMVLEAGMTVIPSKGFLREIYELLGEDTIEIKL